MMEGVPSDAEMSRILGRKVALVEKNADDFTAQPGNEKFEPAMGRKPFHGCKDPFDYVMRYGGAAFQRLVDNAEDAMSFKFRHLMQELLTGGVNTRSAAVRQAIEFFAVYIFYRQETSIDAVKRGQIYIRLAELSGLTVREVRDIVDARIAAEEAKYLKRSGRDKLPAPKLRLVSNEQANDPNRQQFLSDLDDLANSNGGE